jgi:hypothetical protein
MKAIALLVACALVSPGCFQSFECSEVGCSDQATVNIRRADGAAPRFDLRLDVDGRRIECAGPIPRNAVNCDAGVMVLSRELQDCHEEVSATARSLVCTGTGKFELVVQVLGTPKTLRITLLDGGAMVGEKSFEPNYEHVQPNGPRCGPTCRQWGAVWDGL